MYFNIKSILWNHGFKEKESYKNIYIHLYEAFKKAILNKALGSNIKLPPSRILAKDLDISRSTVLKAYNLLVLEKYVKTVKGSGYYVLSSKDKKIYQKLNSNATTGKYPKLSKRSKAFRKNIYLSSNNSLSKGIAFRPGLPPLDIFPVSKWGGLITNYWRNVRPSELSYSNTIGLECLRKNISTYLKVYRNINCNADQIIITSGSLHSLYLISNSLINKGDEVVIENPTYPRAYDLLNSLNAKIEPTAIDEEGICIAKTTSKNPKFIYTTPSNQYPLGIKMSLNRRCELLEWAREKNAFIIEDDYNHEFSNWENPISSVYSLNNEERVIYLGTFNKLLHPSLRLGYMIVPYYLIDTVKAIYEQSSRFVPPSTQKTMSQFIEKDYLNKHLRNVIAVSKERKEIFTTHFDNFFEGQIQLDNSNTGLHLIGKVKNNHSDELLSETLSQNNIIAHPLSNYFVGSQKQNGLVMGYCSVNNKVIKENIYKMYKVYSDSQKNIPL
ncbi:aminotransferase class I/II-fold pyridoxal phosphate-dependent enzyme [Flavobacteriaceae bacterium R38]|nr:aminotransferase class I/II-fold pyridoxal phosphate-dependent enzyme [Flavobacteriaceae bacterium R38]